MTKSLESRGLPGLQAIRTALGLNQRQLAEAIGMRKNAICRIESGSDTSFSTLRKLTEFLGCLQSDLLGIPTGYRISEIKAGYHMAIAKSELAKAKKAKASIAAWNKRTPSEEHHGDH